MQRIVIKIGSSLLTNPDHSLNKEFIYGLAANIADVFKKGNQVLIVTSGAVAAGRKDLQLKREGKQIPAKQCFAAVGQSLLMSKYHKALSPYGIVVAQALLTRSDFKDRKNYLTVRELFLNLLEHRVIPIVNENDVTSIHSFGGNDNLGTLVAAMIDADKIVFMTDVDGLYTGDPKTDPSAKRIPVVSTIDTKLVEGAKHVTSSVAVGGMHSKILAAFDAMKAGVTAYVVDGRTPHVLTDVLMKNKDTGTRFEPLMKVSNARKQWLIANMNQKAKIVVDTPAVEVLKHSGRSVLASGIVRTEGSFKRGDVVIICTDTDTCFACGQVAYDAADVERIKGLHSREIEKTLGFHFGDSVIHRDNMTLL